MALCLIVEDDKTIRGVLVQLLMAEGFEVVQVGSGEAALEQCERKQPEVVLLDLGLPDAEGIQLIPIILEKSPSARGPEGPTLVAVAAPIRRFTCELSS